MIDVVKSSQGEAFKLVDFVRGVNMRVGRDDCMCVRSYNIWSYIYGRRDREGFPDMSDKNKKIASSGQEPIASQC